MQDGGGIADVNITFNGAPGSVVLGGMHANTDMGDGGGLSAFGGTLVLARMWMFDNVAARRGGAIYAVGAAISTTGHYHLTACTADDGGAMFLKDGGSFDGAPATKIWKTTATRGGAVFMSGDTTLRNMRILDMAGGVGGALVCADGACNVLDVDVSRSAASVAGGHLAVLPRAVLTVTNVIFTDSTAVDGGAVFLDSAAELRTSGVSISRSTASSRGGVVFCRGCAAVVGPLLLSDATAHEGGGFFMTVYDRGAGGGGSANADVASIDDVLVRNIDMSDTTAIVRGGGFVVDTVWRPDEDPVVAWRRGLSGRRRLLIGDVCTPVGFDATEQSAVAALANEAKASVADMTSALANGTVPACVPPRVTLRGVTVTVARALAGVGGGVAAYNSTILHRDLRVERCNATSGGGLFLNTSTVQGTNPDSWSTVILNQARTLIWDAAVADSSNAPALSSSIVGVGGGVYGVGRCSVSRVVVIANRADVGGGLAFQNGHATLSELRATENRAATHGGGLRAQDVVLVAMQVTIDTNDADQTGGGVSCDRTTGSATELVVQHNNAPKGAGVHMGQSSLIGTQNQVIDNPRWVASTSHGGGLFVSSGNCSISGFVVARCAATAGGGGIFFDDGARCAIRNSAFRRNSVTSAAGRGGGLAATASTVIVIEDSLFAENDCSGDGALRCASVVQRTCCH